MKKALLFFILSIFTFSVYGQSFLNPSFEINTAGTDQINLTNPAFNGMMANTVAFGSYGDMDIITSTTWCASGHLSNWYVALTGSGTDAFSMRLNVNAPLVAGNSYTISFWDRSCWSFSPQVEIGQSTVNNLFGTSIYVAPLSTYGVWTQRVFTFIAPNNGQYITVQLTGGGLGDWTHVDDFSFQTTSSGPTANFTASNTSICPGSCINFTDLSSGSPTSWSWTFAGASTGSSTLQNPTNICYPTAGTYAVTLIATNASGSNTLNQTTYITVNPPPTVAATASGQLTCTNTSVTLTGTSPGSTMVWNGGSLVNAANPATVTATGTYTVTATSAAGCTNTATITVTSNTVPPIVTAASSGNLTCTNTSVTLTGTGAGTMVWNGGSLSNAANPATVTAAGTYTVTGTDPSNGCTATATITVTSNTTAPTVTASSSGNLSCTVTSVTLTGTSAGNMVWNGGSLVNAANPASVSATGTYTVTATDPANGCTATATVTVTSSAVLPTVTAITSGTITCTNTTVTLTGTSTGNNMVWNGGSLVNAANPATANAAGTYTCTATDPATGCTNTTTVTVTTNTTPPTVTATGNSLTCINTSATLTGTSAGNNMVWNGGSLSNAANPATVSATGTYTVTATNPANGCTSTATVIVTSNTTPPTVTAIASGNVSCTTPNVTLTGTSTGSTMIWNGGSLINAPNPATVNAAGTYTITAVDNTNGCTSTTTVTITSNTTPPTLSILPADTLTCAVGSTTLTANSTTSGVTYSWTGPGIVSGATSANCVINAGGTYTCVVTNPVNGCTMSQMITVVANITPPVAAASGSATINYGNSTPLSATGGTSYQWSPSAGLSGLNCPNCQNPLASPTVTTTYCVAVSDSIGCTDSACVTVIVDIICGEFTFPNAFSPNADGQNDVFRALINPGCISDYHLVIYDRWGEKVFETTNYSDAWDGTYKGELLDNAIFVYMASATLSTTGEKVLKKGNVSLIK
jgi:gliding motility-associated-like protein